MNHSTASTLAYRDTEGRGADGRRAGAPATAAASAAVTGAVSSRLRRLPLPVLLGLMLVAGLCALLALNTASAAQELKQRALTDSNASTLDVEQQLERDLAAKQAPAALASAATAQGLVPNPNPAFLRINADGSVTILGSPAPASVPPPPVTPTPHARTAAAAPTAGTSASSAPKVSSNPDSQAASPTPAPPSPAAPVVTVTVTSTAPSTTASPVGDGGVAAPTPGGH
jgi:hypothetical protein